MDAVLMLTGSLLRRRCLSEILGDDVTDAESPFTLQLDDEASVVVTEAALLQKIKVERKTISIRKFLLSSHNLNYLGNFLLTHISGLMACNLAAPTPDTRAKSSTFLKAPMAIRCSMISWAMCLVIPVSVISSSSLAELISSITI